MNHKQTNHNLIISSSICPSACESLILRPSLLLMDLLLCSVMLNQGSDSGSSGSIRRSRTWKMRLRRKGWFSVSCFTGIFPVRVLVPGLEDVSPGLIFAQKEKKAANNSRYREEVLDLSSRNLKLSSDNGDLSNRLCGEQESVRMLQERLATVSKEQEEGAIVEQLHQQVVSMQAEADLLRFQLLVATQEKLGHAQEVTELHRKLREALSKVEDMQADVRRLMEEKEELHRNLQEETHILRVQNQELQQQLSELQVQDVRVHKLSQEHQNLRSRLDKVETARTQAHDQVRIRIRTKIQRDREGVKTRRDENKLDNRV
ncbi:hypothetical protein XENOCAPTIV_000385 [Xenoophorus captivus]|uniref:Uncharacterized protein n=1 Tax=Xenoophorus captivus TaxID=1517983 RepID=A0ABV0SCS7_9TELE